MSDESSGAGQGALPPRETPPSRGAAERPAMRLSQVPTHVVFTAQPHTAMMPALAQIGGGNNGTTLQTTPRIITLSPGRVGVTSASITTSTTALRPSVANQNIVNALVKSRPNVGVRLQLFPPPGATTPTHTHTSPSNLKRALPPADDRATKLQRLLDHRNVRSKIVREKYNEHLAEKYFLETQGNILDLPAFSKRARTTHFLAYVQAHSIELRACKREENDDEEDDDDEEETEMMDARTSQSASINQNKTVGVNVCATGTSATVSPVTAHRTPLLHLTECAASSLTAKTNHSAPQPLHATTTITTTTAAAATASHKANNTRLSIAAGGQDPQLMEKARQEATVLQRVNDLQKEGLWSERRLPKVQEQARTKAHWDFLLEEMVWLAADFAQERKWKKAAAKKCARMVQKHFQDKAVAAQRAEKAQEQHLRRVAGFCAKEVRGFWSSVEKLVEYKQNTWIEAKRKRALDQHLSFIVDQTEKYSQQLAEGMNKGINSSAAVGGGGVSVAGELPSAQSSAAPSRQNSDDEFRPDQESSDDDEETIAQEEATAHAHDGPSQGAEVEALQRESEMDFATFLRELPKDYLQNRDKIAVDEASSNEENEDEEEEEGNDEVEEEEEEVKQQDDEFVVNSGSEEDDEDTIQEQEKAEGLAEGRVDHARELRDLERENAMSIEELRKKYSGPPPPSNNSDESASDMDVDEEPSDNDEEEDSDGEEEQDVGLTALLDDPNDFHKETKTDKDDLINDAAAIAESIQPKGNTLSSTSVVTPIPFLLKYTLREYQHIGLDWLVTMFERKLNGILADEMGLGKTIQTIALLAHLACEKSNWGPHLIVVPTSVMLNWEMECKKWCPAFKILTYYGSQKERKQKRTGWTKPNAFHICITSYKLVIQDHQSFRRKKWKYLILDEAQNIKNFKSQRWQLLLNFKSQQRLLLTGTPLQNNLMELWSLMHFLMPHVFQSHREFREWFSNPVTGMIEGNTEYNESIIKRLHKVLRPFLLRRLKCEVEKQMPKKYEHVVMCRLSKRQRFLYDDYMSRTKTRETLAAGNLLSVINVLMQLRKVCNHPNLFEERPTVSPFQCDGITWHIPSIVYGLLEYDVWSHVHLGALNLNFVLMELFLSAYQCYRMRQYQTPRKLIEEMDGCRGAADEKEEVQPYCPPAKLMMRVHRLGGSDEMKSDAKVDNGDCKAVTVGVGGGSTGLIVKTPQGTNAQTNVKFKITPTQAVALQVVPHPGQLKVMTAGGQKLTVMPNKELPTGQVGGGNKVVKLHLTTVATPTSNTVPVNAIGVSEVKTENEIESTKKLIGNKFIEKLYSNQSKTLDVRWRKSPKPIPKKNRHGDIEVTDYRRNKLELLARVNDRRCSAVPLYGKDFHDSIKIFKTHANCGFSGGRIHCLNTLYHLNKNDITDCLTDILYTPERRIEELKETFDRFVFYVPPVRAPEPELQVWHPQPSAYWGRKRELAILTKYFSKPATCLHPIASAMVTQFPDPRLIQYDCGKLQTLQRLLRQLKVGGHRVLIFTQMTKMLNVLEAFLNYHGHIYLRLDGSTKVDQRQVLMERFNGDPRIFVFILSTRSGGIGVNLTGADTVIFYDSDWNPTMDAQAQDRCHRIGQTRDVHIYRLVSERTIEENILKKANQKRLLGDLAIEGGNFTTAFFKSSTIQDLFEIDNVEESAANRMSEIVESSKERDKQRDEQANGDEKAAIGALESALAECEDDQDVQAATTAKAEAVADLAEFDETIPLEEQEKEKEPEVSKAEQEVQNIIKQLTPIERYAMRFIEETEAAWSAAQLAAAEQEIEEQKREWEQNRLAALREEEERRARDLEEEAELLTYSREDATNQVSGKSKRTGRKRIGRTTWSSGGGGGSSSRGRQVRRRRTVSHRSRARSNDSSDTEDEEIEVTTTRRQRRCSKQQISYEEEEENDDDEDDEEEENEESADEDEDEEEDEEEEEETNSESLQLNKTTDSDSQYDSDLPTHARARRSLIRNHVDSNSPRTRSRGTVAINLWTLDVSPILPGVKPVRNSPSIRRRRKEEHHNETANDVVDEEDGDDDDGGGSGFDITTGDSDDVKIKRKQQGNNGKRLSDHREQQKQEQQQLQPRRKVGRPPRVKRVPPPEIRDEPLEVERQQSEQSKVANVDVKEEVIAKEIAKDEPESRPIESTEKEASVDDREEGDVGESLDKQEHSDKAAATDQVEENDVSNVPMESLPTVVDDQSIIDDSDMNASVEAHVEEAKIDGEQMLMDVKGDVCTTQEPETEHDQLLELNESKHNCKRKHIENIVDDHSLTASNHIDMENTINDEMSNEKSATMQMDPTHNVNEIEKNNGDKVTLERNHKAGGTKHKRKSWHRDVTVKKNLRSNTKDSELECLEDKPKRSMEKRNVDHRKSHSSSLNESEIADKYGEPMETSENTPPTDDTNLNSDCRKAGVQRISKKVKLTNSGNTQTLDKWITRSPLNRTSSPSRSSLDLNDLNDESMKVGNDEKIAVKAEITQLTDDLKSDLKRARNCNEAEDSATIQSKIVKTL